MMLALRSLLFNILFYANILLWQIALIPTFFMPRRVLNRCLQSWARSNMWLMRMVVGTRVEFRGIENIPKGGLLVASKHQSFWETFALLPYFDDPAFVLKREPNWIPLFGWYSLKARMVPVDRGGSITAIKAMSKKARETTDQGRQLIIFPEGTRRAPGAEPNYKQGVIHLYRRLGQPCLPVALNSGQFWPRRRFMRYPGTIIVEFLPPIPPGLPPKVFFGRLQENVETASNKLMEEANRNARI